MIGEMKTMVQACLEGIFDLPHKSLKSFFRGANSFQRL